MYTKNAYSSTSFAQQKPKKKLLVQVVETIRLKHYAYDTEKTYLRRIREYIHFHNKRYPAEMGVKEIKEYLSS